MQNMFNPEMMNQMKGMLNPQMMKQAASNFANMSDDQIRSYLTASGMGHVDPQTFRAMSGNLQNMDDKDLERIKNSNAYRPPFMNNTSNNNNINTTTTDKTTSAPTKENTIKSANFDTYEQEKRKTVVEQLEDIKNKGNEHFRQGKYKEACEKYYEALNEMEYISDSDKLNFKIQIENLEVVCRLNIANSKLKMEDYDLVIHECLKVLKKTENFKAHYRAGVSFYKKGNYSKAHHHFTKAKEVNQTEEAQQIAKYIAECKQFLEEVQVQEDDKKRKMEFEIEKEKEKVKKEEDDKKEKEAKNNLFNNTSNINETSSQNTKSTSKIDKLKEIINSDVKLEDKSKQSDSRKKEDILIEETIREEPVNTSRTIPNNNNTNSFTSSPYNNIGKELNNMDDNQMNNMVSMMKSMDNATIRTMMSSQGMTVTDEQINLMKNSMTPDMMKMMKDYSGTGARPNMGSTNSHTHSSTCSHTAPATDLTASQAEPQPSLPSASAFPKGFPDLKNMDMSSMMKIVQENPQLLNMMGPQFSQMFGGENGMNGMNNEMMVKSMQNIMWLISIPSKIKAFFTSPRGIIFGLVFLVLIIAYFYR